MPLLKLQTSATIAADQRPSLLARLSETTARLLSKPERYVMVMLDDRKPMLMAADEQPAALIEVRSVGTISAEQARALSKELTAILGELGLASDRVYCNFVAVSGAMWGYDGGTFG